MDNEMNDNSLCFYQVIIPGVDAPMAFEKIESLDESSRDIYFSNYSVSTFEVPNLLKSFL